MSIDVLYIHVATLFRPTRTPDGQGGWSIGYAAMGTVAGRLRPATASERVAADQRQAHVSHVFYCGVDEDVRRDDLLIVEDQTVKVIAVREPSHSGHHLEIDCLEIQKGQDQEAGS